MEPVAEVEYDMSDNEQSIGEAPGDTAVSSSGQAFRVADTTVTPTPEDFSWDDFLAGVRPTRRSVMIYPRGDLIGPMEQVEGVLTAIAEEHEDSGTSAARKKELKAEFVEAESELDRLRDAFRSSGRWFTVEKRSSEWLEKHRKASAKDHGIVLPEDDEKLSPEDYMTLVLDQLAEQIVVPEKVTAEGLRKLAEVNETELGKLITAMTFANAQQAQSAAVLTRDFSLGRSAKSPQGGSGSRSGSR